MELLAHPLQADQVLQWQKAQNMWNKYILPGQVQKMTSAEHIQTLFLQVNLDTTRNAKAVKHKEMSAFFLL